MTLRLSNFVTVNTCRAFALAISFRISASVMLARALRWLQTLKESSRRILGGRR